MQINTDFQDNIEISSHAVPQRTPGTEVFLKLKSFALFATLR